MKMDEADSQSTSLDDLRHLQLKRCRIDFLGWMLVVIGSFFAVTWVLPEPGPRIDPDADFPLARLFFTAAMLLMVAAIPTAYFLRMQRYKKGWRSGSVEPVAYRQGNATFFAWLSCFPAGAYGMHAVFDCGFLPAICVGVFLVLGAVNFPTGGPMREVSPRLGEINQ